ncbi:MAG: hypothetical protein IQL11_08120 [Bacteroidales bacterium]|nr:hypothetical protein [Bacteroidales bacterium]
MVQGKKECIILFMLLASGSSVFADAFPKSPEALGGPVLSVELLGSYEIGFKGKGGLLFWGGVAAVCSPIYKFEMRAGPEAAIEVRHYFSEKGNKKWCVSLYGGVAYNFIDENYGAFTPGLKLTRKKSINEFLHLEPYLGLSYPFYFGEGHPWLPFLTFGYRVVFEKKKK